MRRIPTSARSLRPALLMLLAAACGGGGDGGTQPPVVTSVVITAPTVPPAFQTLTRTAQFAASSGGIPSTGVTVTVAQVVATVSMTPAVVAFGAIGSSRQLVAAAVDSSGATVGSKAGRAPISVTQVVASILVNSTGSDTLKTTGRTKQYAAIVRDSQANVMAGPTVAWSSSAASTATVGAGTGLASALSDGSTNIVATANSITGQRALAVRRYAETFQLTPTSATITTPLGTQTFLGTAQDSVVTTLPIAWTSRTPNVVSLSSGSGAQVTATGNANGTSRVVMSAGTRSDSALVTVSGQTSAPLTATVLVGDTFTYDCIVHGADMTGRVVVR